MHRQLIALRDDVDDRLDVAKVDIWRDTLRVQVESDLYEIDIAGALAIPEQTAFHSLRPCEDAELCGSSGTPTVIVTVKGNAGHLAVFQVSAEVFDLTRTSARTLLSAASYILGLHSDSVSRSQQLLEG